MKKLSLKSLNLNANDMLQREQLKTVFGGYGSDCKIFVRNSAGQGYWTSRSYTVDAAQFYYGSNWVHSGGWRTTGYCCASC